MGRKTVSVLALAVLGLALVTGCGSDPDQTDAKQPRLQGSPDPRVTRPVAPAGAAAPGAVK